MNEFLRDRILRKLDALPDERGYQILDYVEFLESKYAEKSAPAANIFTRLSDTVEDSLRAGRISATTVAETMGLLNRAMGVLSGVAAAGKSVANDVVGAAARVTSERPAATPASPAPPAPAPPTPPTAAAARPATSTDEGSK